MASPRTQRSKKRRPSSLHLALPPPAPAHPSFPRRHTSLVNTLESETDSDVDLSLPTFNFPLRRGSEPTAQLIRRPLFHSLARRPLRRALLIGVATQASSPPEWDLSETNWGLTQDGNFLAAQETREAGSLRAHEDVEAMRTMLIEVFKYRDEGITIMLDREGIAPHLVPTEQNIKRQMRKLVNPAIFGDRFFFYYAGHGAQKRCESDTESDGYDEFMSCLGGWMKDNTLNDLLVKPLPPGAQLFAVIDACCAGTMLDLAHHTCNHANAKAVYAANDHTVCIPFPLVLFVVHAVRRLADRYRAAACERRAAANASATPTIMECGLIAHRLPTLETPCTPPASPIVPVFAPAFTAKLAVSTAAPGSSTAVPGGATAAPIGARICTGTCAPSHNVAYPLVISLSAARDYEQAWENDESGLFTAAFLRAVRAEPGQDLEALLRALVKACELANAARAEQVAEIQRWAVSQRMGAVQAAEMKERMGVDWDDPKSRAAQAPLLCSNEPVNPRLTLTAIM